MRDYYAAAFIRSFQAATDWIIGQGWILSLLLALGVLVLATIFAISRAAHGVHSWNDAFKDLRKAVRDFLYAFIGASIIVLLLVFFVFFLIDAPNTVARTKEEALGYLEQIHGKDGKSGLRADVDLLRDRVSNLLTRLTNAEEKLKVAQNNYEVLKAARSNSSSSIARDADSLYQHDKVVAKFEGETVLVGEGRITFEVLRYYKDFDSRLPSEFRDLRVICRGLGILGSPRFGMPNGGLINGRGSCEIITN